MILHDFQLNHVVDFHAGMAVVAVGKEYENYVRGVDDLAWKVHERMTQAIMILSHRAMSTLIGTRIGNTNMEKKRGLGHTNIILSRTHTGRVTGALSFKPCASVAAYGQSGLSRSSKVAEEGKRAEGNCAQLIVDVPLAFTRSGPVPKLVGPRCS